MQIRVSSQGVYKQHLTSSIPVSHKHAPSKCIAVVTNYGHLTSIHCFRGCCCKSFFACDHPNPTQLKPLDCLSEYATFQRNATRINNKAQDLPSSQFALACGRAQFGGLTDAICACVSHQHVISVKYMVLQHISCINPRRAVRRD